MWFWSGIPESSTLNSALMRNLSFQAGPTDSAVDGSFGGVELAQITESIEPLLLDRLEQRNGVGAGVVEHDRTTFAGLLDETLGEAGGVGKRRILEDAHTLHPVLLGEFDDSAVDQVEARLIR